MEMVATTGVIRRTKLQSNRHHQQTNTQCFTGRMPFQSPKQQCHSTERKLCVWNVTGEKCVELQLVLPWRDNVTIHYTASTAWPVTSSRWVSLSVCLSVCLSCLLSVCLCFCLSLCLCLSVCLSVCLSLTLTHSLTLTLSCVKEACRQTWEYFLMIFNQSVMADYFFVHNYS